MAILGAGHFLSNAQNKGISGPGASINAVQSSVTLYDNVAPSSNGYQCGRWLLNPAGRQTLFVAEDFVIPNGQTWTIDTIAPSLYYAGMSPNNYDVAIYGHDATNNRPDMSNVKLKFTFYSTIPALTSYYINNHVPLFNNGNNLVLGPGTYWISLTPNFNATMTSGNATNMGYWSRADVDAFVGSNHTVHRDSSGFSNTTNPGDWTWWYWTKAYAEVAFRLKGSLQGTTGIAPLQYNNGTTTVWPNPSKEFINLNISDKYLGGTVNIINMLGATVKTISANTTSASIDTHDLSPGMYFYQLKDRNAALVHSGSFIKD